MAVFEGTIDKFTVKAKNFSLKLDNYR